MSGSNIRGSRLPRLTNLPPGLASSTPEDQQRYFTDFSASVFRELRRLLQNGDGLSTDLTALQAAIAGMSVKKEVVELITSGTTWTPPAGCYAVQVLRMVGGGGASGSRNAANTTIPGGGGGAEGLRNRWLTCTPGVNLTISIGAGGTPGAAGDNDGGDGGPTTISNGTWTLSAAGGKGGRKGSVRTGGAGGGIEGGAGGASGGGTGATPTPRFLTGPGPGGGGGANGIANGGVGGAAEEIAGGTGGTNDGARAGGAGGGSSLFGAGANGPNGNGTTTGTPAVSPAATAYGAGAASGSGGNAASQAGAAGAAGAIELRYLRDE